MTTIAYRDGIIAADRKGTSNYLFVSSRTKLRRIKGGVAATMGHTGGSRAILDWLEGGAEGPQPDVEGSLIVATDTEIRCYSDKTWSLYEGRPFYAWGSGCEIALGAMAAGATAVEAVEIACELDGGTGGPVDFMEARG